MKHDRYQREYGQHLVDMVRSGRMTRRQLLVRASVFGIGATAAGQLLAACGGEGGGGGVVSPSASGDAAPPPVMGGTLKVAMAPSLTDIDPVTIYDTGGMILVAQFCEYLIGVNDDYTLKPVLAESWSPNETVDVWTFKLRQGVKFSDGSPFEAEDVVATIDRLVDPESGSGALAAFQGILSPGGTQKVDQYTVAFNLDKPFADFPYLVCQSSYNTVMLPRTYEGDWVKDPVGTGPWLLKDYVSKQSCTAVKNPGYWGKDAEGRALPYMDQVDWVMIEDKAAQTLQLQSGALDVQAETTFQGSQALFADPNLKVLVFRSPSIRELFLATDQDPWKDYRVRQALALCLDRQTINQALFDGRSTLGYDSFWNPDVYPGMPANVVRSQDYAKAKQLLTEAGHADGLSVTLSAPNFLEMPQYAQLVQEQARPAGINVKIQTVDYNAWYAGGPEDAPWLNANAGIVEWGGRPAPSVYVQAMLLPDSAWNSSHWADQEFASKFNEYVGTVDEATRMDQATQLSQMQQDQTPILVSFFSSNLRAMKKNVYGVLGPGEAYIDVAQAYIA